MSEIVNALDAIEARSNSTGGAASAEDTATMLAALRSVEEMARMWEEYSVHKRAFADTVPEEVSDSLRDSADDMLDSANKIRWSLSALKESAQ